VYFLIKAVFMPDLASFLKVCKNVDTSALEVEEEIFFVYIRLWGARKLSKGKNIIGG
jgi:hypothetical protein